MGAQARKGDPPGKILLDCRGGTCVPEGEWMSWLKQSVFRPDSYGPLCLLQVS